MSHLPGGYAGALLRADLTGGRVEREEMDGGALREYIGGVGLGVKYLDDIVPETEWSSPDNLLMFFSGPLAGTRVSGSGTIAVVTKGPMTNSAASTQANGFFGAFLKFSGFDGIVIRGKSANWSYLYIHDGVGELRDAAHLLGKNTWETEQALKQELGKQHSVLAIGQAGEHLVRFACIVGDRGHVAAHNGVGAVMGSKNLKAIVAARGSRTVPITDISKFKVASDAVFDSVMKEGPGSFGMGQWGTSVGYANAAKSGILPVRNYTTNIFPQFESFTGQSIRTRFEAKKLPCWACRLAHCAVIKVTDGPYAGFEGEDPEYEGNAAFSSAIGQTDPGAMIMLGNLSDWLGMDCNECGWLLGWVMECYEKGILKKDDLDGIEMTWGDAEAAAALLHKISKREGIGDKLAEGVKRASESIGGEAVNWAIYTLKGASPRGHDHRTNWMELIDTCFSNTGTIEVTGGIMQPEMLGLAPLKNRFDPIEVSTMNANLNGRRQFEDTLGFCRFCMHSFQSIVDTLNVATGWDFDIAEAMTVGRRIVNQMRMFNLRNGLDVALEAPSVRYGSTPVDGPAKGTSVMPHWTQIRRNYYQKMGWNPETGVPLPETLESLGLGHLGR